MLIDVDNRLVQLHRLPKQRLNSDRLWNHLLPLNPQKGYIRSSVKPPKPLYNHLPTSKTSPLTTNLLVEFSLTLNLATFVVCDTIP